MSAMVQVLAACAIHYALMAHSGVDALQCGGSTLCSNNLCCSQWGWCGSTSPYCGKGCQSGPCSLSPGPPPPSYSPPPPNPIPGPGLSPPVPTSSGCVVLPSEGKLCASAFNSLQKVLTIPLTSYSGRVGTAPSVVKSSHAFYYLALIASLDPTSGAAARALAHLRNVVAKGNAPTASNPLYGWSDGAVAGALALIRSTRQLWGQLSPTDQDRSDWMMKALAVVGNWGFNDRNDFLTGPGNDGNFRKTFNPNFQLGYLSVMTSCALYFGPQGCNDVFRTFSHRAFLSKFNSFGWDTMAASWNVTGPTLFESGGVDQYQGSGVGVKVLFKWNRFGLDKLPNLFYSLHVSGGATPMFSKVVVNSVGRAGIVSGSSPVLGKLGMCYEFDSTDSGKAKIRSDAVYAYEGWMNSVVTRSTLTRFGYWLGPLLQQAEAPMRVGSTDLMYKLQQGYRCVSVKRDRVVVDDSPGSEVMEKGYDFVKDLWSVLAGL